MAAAARKLAAPQGDMKVTTLRETQAIISSSLTAVDLRGLTTLELAFSVLMIAGVTGLILALGLAERQRSFTISQRSAPDHRSSGTFLWSEGIFVVLGGAVLGIAVGFGIAYALVILLAGVFDPPPRPYRPLALCDDRLRNSARLWFQRNFGAQALSKKPDLEALRGG